tara:strand:+ start:18616 stop:20607 length:1992 start_codon:yes stop_codon:yes gene_type:complete
MIIKILLPIRSEKIFFYKISHSKNIKKGTLVEVDFRGKKKIGVIWDQVIDYEPSIKIKVVSRVFYKLCLTDELIKSIEFFSNYSCNSLQLISKLCLTNFSSKYYDQIIETKISNKITDTNHFKFNYKMNDEQKIAFNVLRKKLDKSFNVSVIEGVTNSGKTRVYMNVIIEALKKGLQCVILVPEKILTKQWVRELQKDFNLDPEIYHSSISKKKKNEIWLNTISGKANIIIGTRSAIFLPYKRLGLIVIDEEHDTSFKQEENIIINTRDFGILRAKFARCLVVLASATPSIETYHNCQINKYEKIKLISRVKNTSPPKIDFIDMRLNSKPVNSFISKELELKIMSTLNKKKQSLIFINKRGYAPTVICKKCGHIKQCINCEISLVLHKKTKNKDDLLLCHYCNYHENFKNFCNRCNSIESFDAVGPGIEKVFDEVKKLFPNAKVCLMSSDVINSNKKFEKILNLILNKKIDIIVGTQITSKGHHFPDLDTVGILNMDTLLNSFDLRSSERVYQLITQLAGRAGREKSRGNVLIQTYQPEHPVFKCFNEKELNFFEWEINQRRQLFSPPFSNLISIIIEGKNTNETEEKSISLTRLISEKFENLEILGPAPAVLFKLKNIFRWRILIKILKNSNTQNELKKYLMQIKGENKIDFKIDVDPQNFF